jgi:transposase
MQYTPRRKLTREFKLEAVRQVALSEKPKAQLARELGVRVGQLRTWRLEFEKEAVTGIAKPDRSAAEDLEQLRRENAKLKMEIEILKKCMVRPAIARFLASDEDSLHKCIRPLASGLRLQPGHDEIRARRS